MLCIYNDGTENVMIEIAMDCIYYCDAEHQPFLVESC